MVNWKREIEKLEGWTFGNNAEMADDLAMKTAQGKNLANCFLWMAESRLPKVGDRSYIKNSQGNSVCVVEVVEAHKLPFDEVDMAFALAEGYKTLEEWQEVHRKFFGGKHSHFNEQSLVVCQYFKLIHVFDQKTKPLNGRIYMKIKFIYHAPNDFLYVDYFINPIPALAITGMALNDHWLKYAYPSWITGKLSDFLGVFYFPLLVSAALCLSFNFTLRLVQRPRPSPAYLSAPLTVFSMTVTAAVMMALKLNSEWAASVQSVISEHLFPVQIIADPTDLVALLSLIGSYTYAAQFFERRPTRPRAPPPAPTSYSTLP